MSGYCKEDDATCCADCKHYIRMTDDYDQCAIDAGEPFGEWVYGKCNEFSKPEKKNYNIAGMGQSL